MSNNEGFPVPESTPAPQAPVGAEYDHLFGQSEPSVPSTDAELAAAIERAAVRPEVDPRTKIPSSTSMRTGYWNRPTDKGVEVAAQRHDGTDLARHREKYYS